MKGVISRSSKVTCDQKCVENRLGDKNVVKILEDPLGRDLRKRR
jgi:hypothetical protein